MVEEAVTTLRPLRLTVVVSLLAAAVACQTPAKPDELPKWKLDPLTKNEPAAMAKAGYLNFGPFPFGNIGDKTTQSQEIEDSLQYCQILWIETAHFRIGVNLPAWELPQDMPTRQKIRRELEELQLKIPSVDPKSRKLTPWLRAHMTAYRLEKLYSETQLLFGVKDADFPADPSKVVSNAGARYMGYGPYLGMKDKFLVLVFDKAGPYQAYAKKFIGRDTKMPQRWHFKEISSIVIALACESDQFPLKHDTALHCALAFNVSHNLLDGFRYYAYDLPVWIREGFGHWNCRRIDPKWPNFDQNEGSLADMKMVENWGTHVRGLISSGKVAPFTEAVGWRDFCNIKFEDHCAVWSRIDFLISQGPEKWQKFLFGVKGRIDANWLPDQTDLVGATRDALQQAYGISILEFDKKWAEWTKTAYPLK